MVSAHMLFNFILMLRSRQVFALSTSETSEEASGVDATVRACAQLMHATSSWAAVRGTVASMIQEANDVSNEGIYVPL